MEEGVEDMDEVSVLFNGMLATWHGFVKLRQYTEMNVCDLENSIIRLDNMLCSFQQDVCSQYQTFDLPSEEAAQV